MSLNFEFEDKERFALLSEKEKEHNDSFIWGCMTVDLGEITEKNAEEWHWRYCFNAKLYGALYKTPSGKGGEYVDFIPTLEQVRKRIGLHTNVSSKTRNQFIAKMTKRFTVKN